MTILLLLVSVVLPFAAILLWIHGSERRTQLIGYVSTLAATFAGVWLALYLTDYEKDKDELQDAANQTEVAMHAIGIRWTFSRYEPIPFLDQLAANPVVSKHFDREVFKVLVGFNTLLSDSQVQNDKEHRLDLLVNEYYILCLQQKLLKGGADKTIAKKLAAALSGSEISPEEMAKDQCHVKKAFGAMGI